MKDLFLKYKEVIMYLVFGVLTTVFNIVVYYVVADCLKINYLIANIAAWFLSVLFAYVTNRKYVFESKSDHILKEMISFFSARLATGALDMGFMYVTVNFQILPDFIAKIVANVFVIIANYVLSKLFIFKKDGE